MFEVSDESKIEMFRIFLDQCAEFGTGVSEVGMALDLLNSLCQEGIGNFEIIKEGLQISSDTMLNLINKFTVEFHNIHMACGNFSHEELMERASILGLEEEEQKLLKEFLDQLGRPTEE